MRFYHVAGPSYTPGDAIYSRDRMAELGIDPGPELSDTAEPDPTDGIWLYAELEYFLHHLLYRHSDDYIILMSAGEGELRTTMLVVDIPEDSAVVPVQRDGYLYYPSNSIRAEWINPISWSLTCELADMIRVSELVSYSQ
jgi:hypothetical protein